MLGWTLVWLAGTAAVAGYSITRHAPALERLMRDDVQEAIAPLAATEDGTTIAVSVRDHVATLSGTVEDAAARDALIATASGGLGIRRVVDRLDVRVPANTSVAESEPTPTGPRVERRTEEPAAVTSDAAGTRPLDEADAPSPDARATDGSPSGDGEVETAGSAAADLPPEEAFEVDEAREAALAPDELPGEELLPEDAPEPDAPPEETLALDGPEGEEPLPGDVSGTDAMAGRAGAPVDEAPDPSGVVTAGADSGEPSPTLRLDVVDRVLTIEGSLSKDDDAATLVLMAMDSFELDYVSNTLESDSNVPPADWLAPLADLLPALAALDDPGVDVTGRQVTLYGTAPDAATRDAIVAQALAGLGDYTLVERIDVGGAAEDGSTPPPDAVRDTGTAVAALTVDTDTDTEDSSPGPEAGGAETADPDAPDPDTSDPITSDAAAPGTTDPDAAPPDMADPDAAATDTADPDAADPDAADPDTADPDAADPDAADPDAADPDAADPDTADPDTADSDAADSDAPDLDTPDSDTAGVDGGAPGADAEEAATTDPAADPAPAGTAPPETARDEPDPTDARPPTLASPVAALRAALDEALSGEKILFRSGSARLTDDSRDAIDRIAGTLLDHPDIPVAIEGHTDGIGFRDRNLDLSQRRANAVRDRLVERGVPYGRLTAYGYGEGVPIADNSTPEGRAANRRIEFTF